MWSLAKMLSLSQSTLCASEGDQERVNVGVFQVLKRKKQASTRLKLKHFISNGYQWRGELRVYGMNLYTEPCHRYWWALSRHAVFPLWVVPSVAKEMTHRRLWPKWNMGSFPPWVFFILSAYSFQTCFCLHLLLTQHDPSRIKDMSWSLLLLNVALICLIYF